MNIPLPADEPQRLESLQKYEILNTPPEAAFDRITTLAARIFGVPIALVSLVDRDRQWFKSCYGVDVRETGRELSFCAYAILTDEVMVVPDATQDARFANNPLVTGEQHIRFYAGAPLQARDGYKLGTLCVIDTKPRDLSDEQRATLSALAAMTVDALELRIAADRLQTEAAQSHRRAEALEAAEARAQLIVETAHDAFVSMDADGLITGWNRRAEAIFGLPRSEAIGRPLAETIIPPSFRAAHWRGLKKFLETGQGPVFNQIFEISAVRRDGTVFPVELSISPLRLGESYVFTAFVRDISERKQSEETLARQTVAFQEQAELLDLAHDSILVVDWDGTIIFWNRAAERMYGWTQAEALGKNAHRLLQVQLPRPLEELKEVLLCDGAWEGEAIHTSRDGTPITVATRWVLKRGDKGGAAGILKISNDITTRKEAETALQAAHDELEIRVARRTDALARANEELNQTSDRLQAMMDNTTSLIYIKDLQGRYMLANRQLEKFFGVDGEQIIGKTDRDFLPAAQADALTVHDQQTLQSDHALDFEEEASQADGLHTYISTKFPLRNGAGNVYALGGISTDISERKRAEEAGVAFRLLVESVRDYAIFMLDPDGNIISWNAGAERIKGYSAEEIIGRHFSCFYTPEDILRGHPQWELQQAMAEGHYEEEGWRVRKDGSRFWVNVVLTAVHDETGQLRGFAKVTRDITDRKRGEDALQAAKEAAERANSAKSELLSRTSHELRTPLNAILGFGQLLEMDDLNEEQQSSVEEILKAGRHQLQLVNRVLDVGRLETGKLEITLESLAVGQVLRESLEVARPLAEARQMQLHLDASATGHAALRVMADRARLGQVLLNLLSNAVQYNRAGGSVTVSAAPVENSDRLRLTVKDTGNGLAPEEIARLFRLFDRIGAEEAGVKGTGIGLTLAKGMIEAMGGAIGVESVPGQGSNFWVELPLAPGAAPAEDGAKASATTAQTVPEKRAVVLYIEDNLSNLMLVQHILRQRPEIQLLTAMQGTLGLELARQYRPALILLDLHLPDVQGDEVLRRLQADGATREIPVVVVSADAMPRQIEQLLSDGARDFLTKPIEVKKFLAVLDEELSGPKRLET